jgi:plasmid stability protein
MTTLTVRDVDREIAQALKVRAAANGRSAEAEHRMILRAALSPSQARAEDFAAAAARLRTRLRHDGDSTALVRAARDGHPDAGR